MIIRSLINWLIGLLPDFVINETLWGHVLTALSWASWANYYLPINTFILCIGMYFTVYVGRAVLKLVSAGQF